MRLKRLSEHRFRGLFLRKIYHNQKLYSTVNIVSKRPVQKNYSESTT